MDEPSAADALAELLRSAGADVTDAELGAVMDAAIERLVLGSPRTLDREAVAERAGVDVPTATRFWRAMGFPDVEPGSVAFTETDVEMLRRAVEVVRGGVADEAIALQMTRVMGRAASRIATAQLDVVRERVRTAIAAGGSPELEGASTLATAASTGLLDELETFLGYLWRRHLAAVAERQFYQALAGVQPEASAVVGFADLVGFTAISQRMDDRELAAAVSAFEAAAYDVIGERGGRVVKMLGDEVMFSAPEVADAAAIALSLVDVFAADDALPDVRVGLAAGTAVPHHGDLFGPAPNLASRLVDVAYPGTVLVSESVHDAISGDERFVLRSVRAHRLKGLGRTPMWALRRAG